MDKKESDVVKKLLCEFFGFMKHKIETDGLTLEEQQALLHIIEDSVPVYATADDLASYFNRSREAIHLIVHRKLLAKPKRRVLYDFREFRKIVPDKWRK